jgi:isoleucyl-tRNA synthetase
VQVDPIKSKLKPPGTKRLKLKCDESLSNFAFKINLRRYTLVAFTTFLSNVYLDVSKDRLYIEAGAYTFSR